MPRKRAIEFDNQRELIIKKSAILFARNGFAATTMNEIADTCGLSKATIYHYVSDKYELLVDICEGHILRLCSVTNEVSLINLKPQDKLRLMIKRFLEEYSGAQNEHRVLTEDIKFLSPKDKKRIMKGERDVVNAMASVMIEVRPELEKSRMAKPLTMLLFGMINWMFMWHSPNGELSHQRMADVVCDLLLGGLNSVRLKIS